MSDARANFTLRPVNPGDASRIAELIGDWDVARWLSGPPHPYTLADAETFLAGLPAMPDSAARHEALVVDGRLAGLIGIDMRADEPNRGHWNLGFWLGRPYWHQGIMGQAAALLTRDFFAKTDETLLKSGYFSGNEASAAIQRRLGFVSSGESLLFNRPQGKRLPHVETVLTRDRYEVARKRDQSN